MCPHTVKQLPAGALVIIKAVSKNRRIAEIDCKFSVNSKQQWLCIRSGCSTCTANEVWTRPELVPQHRGSRCDPGYRNNVVSLILSTTRLRRMFAQPAASALQCACGYVRTVGGAELWIAAYPSCHTEP